MNRVEVIVELERAQKELNKLLIIARNHDLKVTISISKANCFGGDTAEAIGLDIYRIVSEYSYDGIP